MKRSYYKASIDIEPLFPSLRKINEGIRKHRDANGPSLKRKPVERIKPNGILDSSNDGVNTRGVSNHTVQTSDKDFDEPGNMDMDESFSSTDMSPRSKKRVDPALIKQLLVNGVYPEGCTSNQRNCIKRASNRNYKYEDSKLWFKKYRYTINSPEYSWREVILEKRQQFECMQKLHVEKGIHLSRKETQSRIEDLYFWPDIPMDVNHFVNNCCVCSGDAPANGHNIVDNGTSSAQDGSQNKSHDIKPELFRCSLCEFSTTSRQAHLQHSADFHVWRCRCGFGESNGDRAALHLLECPEITVSTKFAKRIKKKGVQEFSDKAKQKQLQNILKTPTVLELGRPAKAIELEGGRPTKAAEVECGKCAGCKLKKNCGKCKFCQNLSKNGKIKQTAKGCIKRRCTKSQAQSKKSAASSSKTLDAEARYQLVIEEEATQILAYIDQLDLAEHAQSQSNHNSLATKAECSVKLETAASAASSLPDTSTAGVTSSSGVTTPRCQHGATSDCCMSCLSGVALNFSQSELQLMQTLANNSTQQPAAPRQQQQPPHQSAASAFQEWFDKLS